MAIKAERVNFNLFGYPSKQLTFLYFQKYIRYGTPWAIQQVQTTILASILAE
jgi:hypothetical protein